MAQDIIPTPQDFALLLQQNPLAAAQLKAIVLERENAELEAKLAEYTATKENGHATQGEGERVQVTPGTSQA